jgi:hypothetical protein
MDNGSDTSPAVWVFVGSAAALALYFIFRGQQSTPTTPGVTQSAPVAPLESPSKYQSIGAVSVRFDQVKELYRMGYMTPDQTMSEIDTLEDRAIALQVARQGDPASTIALLARMSQFRQDVAQFAVSAA